MRFASSSLFIFWQRRIVKPCIELLSSMRFAIALLVVLALASVIGTVLKQDARPSDYIVQFGPFWADIFAALGLQNVYSCVWFLGILVFLVLSLSLCVARKWRQKLAHMRSWKDHIRLESLRTFRYHAQWKSLQTRSLLEEKLGVLLQSEGYRFVVRHFPAAHAAATSTTASPPLLAGNRTLIAAKRGTWNKLGYFATHIALIVICLGGLLDSHLPLQAQKTFLGKRPLPIADLNALPAGSTLESINPIHRLSSANPTFRGYAWVPEKQTVTTALINEQEGVFLQELPFTLELNKFIVEYYSTGMPKRFASEVTVRERISGKQRHALIEVNRPLVIDGLAIYQSSFEDGGSVLQMTAHPMAGRQSNTALVKGKINEVLPLAGLKAVDITKNSAAKLELTGFRAINVENIAPLPDTSAILPPPNQAASSEPTKSSEPLAPSRLNTLIDKFKQHLGSGAKAAKPTTLHNIGPSIQYKIRDQNGQAHEFNQYMLPIPIPTKTSTQQAGVEQATELFFLTGMRANPSESFRYLRIPADAQGSVQTWMRLRAALQDPTLRAIAAKRFAQHAAERTASSTPPMQSALQDSAQRVLTLFAGNAERDRPEATDHFETKPIDPTQGGFGALAAFINQVASPTEQERAAGLLLRLLEGSMWELWQEVRKQAHQPTLNAEKSTPEQRRFLESSISALSELLFYPAPLFLQLESYQPITASVFQVTKMPGKLWVYLGSLFLLLGIVILFYVRERRIWVLLQDVPVSNSNSTAQEPCVAITVAFSSPRHSLASEREFSALKGRVAALIERTI